MHRVRTERRLKAKDLDKLSPGLHEDGGGLRLVVEPTGARRWVLRLTIAGRRHSRGLGPYPLGDAGRMPGIRRWTPGVARARAWTSPAEPRSSRSGRPPAH
jgi:Arm DNA-binding domain